MASLADLIKGRDNLSLVYEAISAAGALDKLEGKTKYTVFAPTNDAIKSELASLNISKEEFFADKSRLENVIKFHIVPDEIVYSKEVKEDKSVKTANGQMLELAQENDNFSVNGTNISMRDLVADNGVVHVIDKVLIPQVTA